MHEFYIPTVRKYYESLIIRMSGNVLTAIKPNHINYDKLVCIEF